VKAVLGILAKQMKTCSKCKESKLEECFAKKTKGKLQPWCKNCNRSYQKSHYKANKQKRVSQVNEYKKDRRLQLRQRLYQFLLENPCVDCGENDPVVLEFDHVRGQKNKRHKLHDRPMLFMGQDTR
tara:strand:+ start:55 stop:432 length:378 start_codon:yes stop_codon:yes gene_type:complete